MEYTDTGAPSSIDTHSYARVRWGAVIGGWLVATGIASLMYVAGLALGFSAFDPYSATATAKGIGIGTAIWVVLTWAVSLFLGGMFASWFDGKTDQTVGTLHGVTVWALSVAASGLLLAHGLTQVAQGTASLIGGSATAGAAAAGAAAPNARGTTAGPADDAVIGLQAQLTRRVVQTPASGATNAPSSPSSQGAPTPSAGAQAAVPAPSSDMRRVTEQPDRQSMADIANALIKGNTENAKALLAANTSMSQAEIDQTLQSMSPQIDKAKADAQAAADTAARYTSRAMWIMFFSGLLALVAAAIGGWLGSGHVHRVYHLRHYETTTVTPH